MKAISTTVSGSPLTLPTFYAATVTPSLPARQVTIGQYPTANPNWSRIIQVSDEFIFVKRGEYAVAISLADLVNIALIKEIHLTWTPPVVLTQLTSKTAEGTVAATGTITSDNTNVSDADTVTIGSTVYRFKNTLAAAYDVKIGASADATLLNLIKAINASGTAGTEYYTGTAAHPLVTAATSVTAHAFAVTARAKGTAGNSIASTETSSHLSWGAATLAGGTGSAIASFVFTTGSEYTQTYAWYESADGVTWGSALTTTGIYDVSVAGTLTITNPSYAKNGYYYKCTVTDNAGASAQNIAEGIGNGSVTSNIVQLTVA